MPAHLRAATFPGLLAISWGGGWGTCPCASPRRSGADVCPYDVDSRRGRPPQLGRVKIAPRYRASYGGVGDSLVVTLERDPVGHLPEEPPALGHPQSRRPAQLGIAHAPAAAQPPGLAPALGRRRSVEPGTSPTAGVAREHIGHGGIVPAGLPGDLPEPPCRWRHMISSRPRWQYACRGGPWRPPTACFRGRHRSAAMGRPAQGMLQIQRRIVIYS